MCHMSFIITISNTSSSSSSSSSNNSSLVVVFVTYFIYILQQLQTSVGLIDDSDLITLLSIFHTAKSWTLDQCISAWATTV